MYVVQFQIKFLVVLPQARPNGYLARSCKNLAKMVILQDLARRWLSCKILQDEWLSCKILARRMVILQDSCVKKLKENKNLPPSEEKN